MEKDSKLGVSVGLLGFVCYLLGYFSISMSALLFVLLLVFAENKKVKVNAASALSFALIITVIQDVLDLISVKFFDIIKWFGAFFTSSRALDTFYEITKWLNQFDIVSFISGLIGIVFFVMMVVFAFSSLKGKTVKTPFVYKTVCKAFDYEEEN